MLLYKLKKEDYDFFLREMGEITAVEEYSRLNAFIQHGDTTCYAHSVDVAYQSYIIAKQLRLKLDYRSLIRGALLHDFFLYDWHKPDKGRELHGFSHPRAAHDNAVKHYKLNAIEKDIILTHMWPLTLTKIPRFRESSLVCAVDKIQSLKETAGYIWYGLKKKLFKQRTNAQS